MSINLTNFRSKLNNLLGDLVGVNSTFPGFAASAVIVRLRLMVILWCCPVVLKVFCQGDG